MDAEKRELQRVDTQSKSFLRRVVCLAFCTNVDPRCDVNELGLYLASRRSVPGLPTHPSRRSFVQMAQDFQILYSPHWIQLCRLIIPSTLLGFSREDLYYRLKVLEIALPPLRERREDIPLLINHFLTLFNKTFNKNIEGISEDALRIFMIYPWPGNIRELQHAIEHAFVLCNSPTIALEHLPVKSKNTPPGGPCPG